MNSRSLTHARMTKRLEKNHYPSLCTLKEPTKEQNSVGEEVSTHDAHPGYEGIHCRVGAAGGGQRRGNEQVYLEATHRIVLLGDYPDVAEQWLAEVDGTEYTILYVARSEERVTTRLECRIIR